VGREPDELGIERRHARGDEAGARTEDAPPDETEGGHQQGAG
jgi:hypothetical protein